MKQRLFSQKVLILILQNNLALDVCLQIAFHRKQSNGSIFRR
jgi:hypothetical protein